MFSRILKNDLKRKKTMNIILLLFVILSVTFASSSINIMISVYGGIDYFLEKANMSDYVVITRSSDGVNPADDYIEAAGSVTESRKEDVLFYSSTNLTKDGKTFTEFENPGVILPICDTQINYFDKDNEIITDVERGHIYVGGVLTYKEEVHIGDTITLELGDKKLDLIIDGFIKDALLGSPFMNNPRMLMNDEDAEILFSDEEIISKNSGAIYYLCTDDMKELKKELADIPNAMFSNEIKVLRLTFMLDMLVAGLLLVVSICLIIIAFTMLSFTIKFTLGEDFREIGVMKAVGLKSASIRGLYMIKYLCISTVGAVIGYICSIPFQDLLLKSVSDKIVIGNDDSIVMGILTACIVVLITLSFCYSCTKSIKKLSPIDAVRNGETGERYSRKSVMKLSKSRLGSSTFLAVNDVVSKPKQYLSMIITFTVCMLLISMLANATNTLMSEKLLFLFGTTKSDVYYSAADRTMMIMGSDEENAYRKEINDIEKILADNGMPGTVHVELLYAIPVEFGDTKIKVQMEHCPDTNTTDYTYSEGVAPLYENEVAFTPQVLEELGAEIGDTVILEINGEKKECIITASIISMNQLGRCGRLHESVPVSPNNAAAGFAFQIDFDDNPSYEVVDERIEKLKTILDSNKVYDVEEFVDACTSSSATITTAKNLVLIISLIIAALITVLMERSFISKEASEIALMKAIGFKSRSICAQHSLRFLFVVFISGILAAVFNIPFTTLICDRIFSVMGAISGISYNIKPLEVLLIYPLIICIVVVITAYLTSLYARSIKTQDMGNIE